MKDTLFVGMFGTCGSSEWRKPFITEYQKDGMSFFNPQVDDWTPDCAVAEAWHLANDQIVLFPVTDETYAVGSLAETGFSIMQAMKFDDRRDIIIMISRTLSDELMQDKERAKESIRARALVLQHLQKINLPNVYLVDTLDEMLMLSKILYDARMRTKTIENWSLQKRYHTPGA